MKSIGIFICNYNKQEFVVNCVKSILEQTFNDFDLYVIDNASTDDSVIKLKKNYGSRIKIIENKENLGGSGGFNTGINLGYSVGYKYIMLVDNDTIFDVNAVFELYNFLENNENVGMVGSKIYYMKEPEMIQEFGGKIDFQEYKVYGVNKGCTDNEESEKVQEVDYLSACSLMIRREVIEKIGVLDEKCFIYFDDTDFGYRCKLNGYKCCAISSSKVWHNGSFVTQDNLGFTNYYFWRNKFNFFAKYILDSDIERFAVKSLQEVYRRIVGYYSKKQYDMATIVTYSLLDFLNGVRGKAGDEKIKRGSSYNLEPFYNIILSNKEIFIEKGTENVELGNFVNKIVRINSNICIFMDKNTLQPDEIEQLKDIVAFKDTPNSEPIFVLYNHVRDVEECILPKICVDNYLNCIWNNDTYFLYNNYTINEALFISTYKGIFIDRINKIRSEL